MMNKSLFDKFLGVMIGGAVGDALGAGVECLPVGSFPRIDGYRAVPDHGLDAGERTDDTAMALLLADSLVRKGGFDLHDQYANYLKWMRNGYMGLRSYPYGMGRQTRFMLNKYRDYIGSEGKGSKPWELNMSNMGRDGNGSLMRIGPIPLFWYDDAASALKYAGRQSLLTHPTDLCIVSCIFYTGLIWGALHGADKKELLSQNYSPIAHYWEENYIPELMISIFAGDYKNKTADQFQTSGYVLNALELALWAFYQTDDFRSGMEKIVNLGGDTDTNACVYGYLAGVYYGYQAIPQEWREGLAAKDRIRDMASKLFAFHSEED